MSKKGVKKLNPADERKAVTSRSIEEADRQALEMMKDLERKKREKGLLHKIVLKNGIAYTTRPETYLQDLKKNRELD